MTVLCYRNDLNDCVFTLIVEHMFVQGGLELGALDGGAGIHLTRPRGSDARGEREQEQPYCQ